jgi:hypothetical protein
MLDLEAVCEECGRFVRTEFGAQVHESWG